MASYWDGVVEWLKEDEAINKWLDEDQIAILKELDNTKLELWKAATQYQGFDVKLILRNMKKNYDAFMKAVTETTITETIKTPTGKFPFKYSNHEKMMEDITFIIFIFATRGSDWDKIKSKSVDQVKLVMSWMVDKYGLDTEKNNAGASLRPDAVTVPRVAACFPMKVCDFFHKGMEKPLISMIDLTSDADFIAATTKAILSSSFPACIPPTWVVKDSSVHYITFLVAVMNDEVLHRKDGHLTPLTSMLSYYSACYRSNETPLKSRVAWCSQKGLGNPQNTGFSADFLKIVDASHTKIMEKRSSDPALKTVIMELYNLV